MKPSDKLFFIVQSFLKYNSFDFGVSLRSLFYKPFFKKYGAGIRIKDGTTFKFPSEIELGDGCIIGEFCYVVGKGGLKIGKYALMAAGTKIITSTHTIEDIRTPMALQGLSYSPIEIGDDVWMGFDVKIFGNTFIGDGVVIGAGSMVKNTTVESFSVIAGIPARVIRKRKGTTGADTC